MWFAILLLLLILVVLAVLLAVAHTRQPSPPVPPAPPRAPPPPYSLLQEQSEARGSELLVRRSELEERRGALSGLTDVDEALQSLEERLARGEITPEDFERDKVRLLGGTP